MSSASPSVADPLVRLAKRERRTWAAALLLLGLVAAWAFRPLSRQSIDAAAAETRVGIAEVEESDGFDAAAFEVELWKSLHGEEPAPALAASAVPATPFRLQLVGVIEDEGQLFAALYDPDADTLRLVRNGESLGRHRIESITLAGVTVSDGRSSRELKIEGERR